MFMVGQLVIIVVLAILGIAFGGHYLEQAFEGPATGLLFLIQHLFLAQQHWL